MQKEKVSSFPSKWNGKPQSWKVWCNYVAQPLLRFPIANKNCARYFFFLPLLLKRFLVSKLFTNFFANRESKVCLGLEIDIRYINLSLHNSIGPLANYLIFSRSATWHSVCRNSICIVYLQSLRWVSSKSAFNRFEDTQTLTESKTLGL